MAVHRYHSQQISNKIGACGFLSGISVLWCSRRWMLPWVNYSSDIMTPVAIEVTLVGNKALPISTPHDSMEDRWSADENQKGP